MKIRITQKDIDAGVENSMEECPIALAIRRELNCRVAAVAAKVDIYYYSELTRRRQFSLSEEALDFLNKFDEGKHVTPLKIEITEE